MWVEVLLCVCASGVFLLKFTYLRGTYFFQEAKRYDPILRF